jgi:hypothetical protein
MAKKKKRGEVTTSMVRVEASQRLEARVCLVISLRFTTSMVLLFFSFALSSFLSSAQYIDNTRRKSAAFFIIVFHGCRD